MNPHLKTILAVLAGLILGSCVNMGLIMLSSSIIPLPAGVDVTTEEGLKAAMPLFEPRHFIMPFLAHALGTLAGAFLATLLSSYKPLRWALFIGILFFVGGLMEVLSLNAPIWFNVSDLVLAYMPMAFLGWKLAMPLRKKEESKPVD